MATCIVPVPADSPFSIHNLPYGVFRPSASAAPRPGIAIGDHVLDLSAIATAGLFNGPLLSSSCCFSETTLNSFMAMGRPAWKEARATVQQLLSGEVPTLQDNSDLKKRALIPMNEVKMEVPAAIGDYTDFFCSEHHTKNCSKIFRGEFALPPNWLHLPVAYHGRASSVVVSGTDITRPMGQSFPPTPDGKTPPYFGPSRRLDYELEMAFFVGPGCELGDRVTIENAYDHIFGLVLMNDWSARDIQFWEAQPLGPFLGKSFGTSISPWIVTLEALEPFKCDAPKQDPPCLPYLTEPFRFTFDIPLEVAIKPVGDEKKSVTCRTNFKYLYWTMAQQLTHHTINGCNLRTGDLLASGTISGPDRDSLACLLEQTSNGQEEFTLEHGGVRKYLEDGDEVIFSGCCKGDGFTVGFGTCSGFVERFARLLLV
ncbi:hypothetical protein GOP47_0019630 [Adiantum capillus-veneris]|uniref:Fumarylacetoacetase n=1 Tax=Adiantum capillus-veneris TaxID=13818 RepID=A0A9D4UBV2_ADICA|nr:hypothetical protein GOP47_0019630 [Adiantum capillus-veneris]